MRGDKNCARDAAVGKISLFYAADSNFFSKARHVSNLPTGTLDLCNDSFYITRNFRSQFPNGIQDWFIQPLLSKLNINMIEDCKPFFFLYASPSIFFPFFCDFSSLDLLFIYRDRRTVHYWGHVLRKKKKIKKGKRKKPNAIDGWCFVYTKLSDLTLEWLW